MRRAELGGGGKLCSAQCQRAGKSKRERCIYISERLLGVEGVSLWECSELYLQKVSLVSIR